MRNPSPSARPRVDLDLHGPGGLAALFTRTRTEFGGHTMTAGPAPEAGQAAPPAGTEGTPPAGGTAGGTPPAAGAEPEPQEGEDAAALLARIGPDAVAKLALRYRTEAGDRRQGQRTAEQQATEQARTAADTARAQLLEQLKPGLVALGVLQDDSTPDPAKLASDLQAAQQQSTEQQQAARTLALENAVLRNATDPQGLPLYNTTRMLDSRSFAATLASLDPTADDFSVKVVAAMKEAADKDASFKATRAVARAGVPLAGGSGEASRTGAPKTLADAVAGVYQQ